MKAGLAALAFLLAAGPAPVELPRDHGNHPDAALEWWYVTGHLATERGAEYGFQVTFFRLRDFHLAHFAFTDPAARRFLYDEKAHLGIPGVASSASGRLDVSNEDWRLVEENGVLALTASGKGVALELSLSKQKPAVLHGDRGLSRKGAEPNAYSRYVSFTRLAARGTVRTGSARERVTGTAWLDHEWGPGALPDAAVGWDWFALQLSDGSDLMLYRIRTKEGGATPFSSGTFVPARGTPRAIAWSEVTLEATGAWTSPASGARYPAGWRIRVASIGLDVAVTPILSDQELRTERSTRVTYWEGACRVAGTRAGRPLTGRAYAELTGYAGRDVPGFSR
jgi:predicted secreted hydrolase